MPSRQARRQKPQTRQVWRLSRRHLLYLLLEITQLEPRRFFLVRSSRREFRSFVGWFRRSMKNVVRQLFSALLVLPNMELALSQAESDRLPARVQHQKSHDFLTDFIFGFTGDFDTL